MFSNFVNKIAGRQEGQAMVEYGLLAGLISVVAIVSLTAISGDVTRIFAAVAAALNPVLAG
jgi:Flp pilus assembly pilin Flp